MVEKQQIKQKFERLKSQRGPWNNQYAILGEYVSQIRQSYDGSPNQGEFLNAEIFDSTGTFAAHNAASALLGMLWPGTAKQAIEIVPPDEVDAKKSTEVADFYKRMTDKTCAAMDDPRANLPIALDEYMLSQVIEGTSGIGIEEGYESKLLYRPYGVREMFIEEGRNGKVSELYLLIDYTLSRVVREYGVDKLSDALKQKWKDGKADEMVTVLIWIGKRDKPKAERGKFSMPYVALHMEYKNDLHELKEDGFEEFPIAVGRFRKLNYEKYGRSPAMNALPDIREANALREAVIIATEKNLDPPMGVLSDGVLGGGIIDTSAGAINVVNASMGTGNPIFPLVTVGSIPDALARLEELRNTIAQHFSIDRLIDFNNEQEMTFGEAQIRNQIRTASLSSLFSRQIAEVFTPFIERSVNMLFRMGEYGVVPGSEEEQEALDSGEEVIYVPDEIVKRLEKGLDIYQVTYKTQAANASRAEEYMSILDVMRVCGEAMQVDPSVRNRVDFHKALKEISSIRGVDILRQDDEVDALNEEQQEQIQAAQQAEQENMASGTIRNVAGAAKEAGLV